MTATPSITTSAADPTATIDQRPDRRLSPEAAARIAGVSTNRLRQLAGRLDGQRIPGDPRGRRTYSERAVRAYANDRAAAAR